MTNEENYKRQNVNEWTLDSGDYNKWILKTIGSEKYRRTFAKALQKGLKTDEKLEILDVGTGPGVMAFILAENGHRVTGIDLAEGMVEKAKSNAKLLNLNVKFETGDAENLPFADESFDAVVNRIVLWNLPNPEKALAEWKRVLRPGGRLIVIDTDGLRLHKTLKHKALMYLSVPFVLFHEKRNPLQNHRDRSNWHELPLANVSRPAWEKAKLAELGFTDIDSFLISRWESGVWEFFKYNCWGDYFVVSATKK
jgi:ubiquinone/menaquinone biosynthesis C-methylase UbiE